MIRTISKTSKIIFKRLPRIAIYTFAFYLLFFVAQHFYYWAMPGEHFVKFYKIQVQNAEEGEEIPFQVCRTKRANYQVEGFRTFYSIPNNDDPQGVRTAQVKIQGALEDEECANLFVRLEQFTHTPGNYYFVTELRFSVEGFDKFVRYKSNVYTVTKKQQLSPDEIQKQIDELQMQIDRLREQLALARADTGNVAAGSPPNNTNATQTQPQPIASSTTSPSPSPQPTQPQPVTPTVPPVSPPERSPIIEMLLPDPVCVPLLITRVCI